MEQLDERFQDAIQQYWAVRSGSRERQVAGGVIDAGTRSEVTAGKQMAALEALMGELLEEAGLRRIDLRVRSGLELPGYFRPEKKWDLLAVADGQLVTAIEFKSQVGPSFGNNYNNRVEEALGNASDIWTAFREGRLGTMRPLLGYFFLLEDTAAVHRPVKASEPHFGIDPVFRDASYARRYEVLCQRLVLERLYDATCLTLATNAAETMVRHPVAELGFQPFVAQVQGHARAFAQIRRG